jgi:hypothetical protein
VPVAAVTSVLATGLLPMFVVETAPTTTRRSAEQWAMAYTNYAVAGGVIAAVSRRVAFANALETAFNPELSGGGPPLFMSTLSQFWIGLPVPGQLGVVALFTPSSTNVDSPQSANATPQDQANGLAAVIASITLGSVKVQVLPTPPGVIVPLL